jgi:hypothetical protein
MSNRMETPQERKEAAAIRRRWITLGEVLAVIAVLISGLTLWNSYSERHAQEAERAAEKAQEATVSRTLLLKASGNGKKLTLTAQDPDQAIQSQTILFPSALGVAAIETVIEPRIEGGWIKAAVKKARELEGKQPKVRGDARLPVAITTRFASGGDTFSDTAIYDVGYKESGGGLFGGTDIELRGLSLVERVRAAKAHARLDAVWRVGSR